VYVNIDS